MKNLEQIRAANAFKTGENPILGKNGGEVIKKIPPIIQNHGLLAGAAYACDQRDNGWKVAFAGIVYHLSHPDIHLLPEKSTEVEDLIRYLTRNDASSEELKLITAETLQWFNYARRFVSKTED